MAYRIVGMLILSLCWCSGDLCRAQDYDLEARRIVEKMTLDEKIAQIHGIENEQHYRYIPPLPRLGIPALRITNGPAGVGPGDTGPQPRATALPAPIALAATWNPALAHRYGELAASETKSFGYDLLESPDVNIVRVPQSGRAFETLGEDPYLTSRIAVAEIEGIQAQGVMANVKHYLANNQETNRLTINEIVEERALREIYMPAFEASVKEGHVASIMCAYPKVNGQFLCENKPLLRDVVEGEWRFDGFITSDFGAVHSTVSSAIAGLDLELPTGKYFSEDLKSAVKEGTLPVSTVDEMLVRRYRTMMRFGLFKKSPIPKPIPVMENGAVARKISEESMVLLKNEDHLLPLDAEHLQSIALIGPGAVRVSSGGGGSSHVIPFYTVEPVDGIQAHMWSQRKVLVLDGSDIDAAVAAAKSAEVAVVFVGDDEGEDHDHSLSLGEKTDRLILAVAGANAKTVVVVKSGSAVLMPWVGKVAALLEAWYPGQEDGNAVADVLFGTVNPSGKLPITFPRIINDTLAQDPELYPGTKGEVHYSEGLKVGYRWYDSNKVVSLFPFGFGLSYTTFSFRHLSVERQIGSEAKYYVSFDLTNTGGRKGAEVAQLYIGEVGNGEPPKQLKGFKKVTLSPGATERVHIPLRARDLSYWNTTEHKWASYHGKLSILIGNSDRDIFLQQEVDVP